MKTRMIALLLSVVLASGSIGTAPVLAAEPGTEESATEQEKEPEENASGQEEGSEADDTSRQEEESEDNISEQAEGSDNNEEPKESSGTGDTSENEDAQSEEDDPSATVEEEPYEEAQGSEKESGQGAETGQNNVIQDTVDEVPENEEESEEFVENEAGEAPGGKYSAGDSGTWGDNLDWALTGEEGNLTLTITCIGDMKENTTNYYDGYPWFNTHDEITALIINPGITSIPSHAFRELNITELDIPDGVHSIGNNAFSWCDNLQYAKIPNSVTSIGFDAFVGCSSLTSIKLPNKLTAIEGSVFCLCNQLSTVYIPISVTHIKIKAFDRCTGLTDVYYEGSEAEWDAVTIEGYNDALTNATMHYNYSYGGNIELEPKLLRMTGETFTIAATYKGPNLISSAELEANESDALEVGDISIWDPVASGDLYEIDIFFEVTTKKKGKYNLTISVDDGTEASAELEIISNDIADAEVQLADVYRKENGYDCFVYTGSGIKPAFDKVTLDGIELVMDQDYTASYSQNTAAGYGTITLSGTGKYEGINRITFIILPPKVSGLKLHDDICTDETHDAEHIHGKIGVEWDKASTSSGYNLEISRYPEFYEIATETEVIGSDAIPYYEDTILRESGSKWYVRTKAFIKVDGKKYDGEWSDVLPVTICHHFLLARDTNQFPHTASSFFNGEWITNENGEREFRATEEMIYATSKEYYERLKGCFAVYDIFGKYDLNMEYLKEWGGSCHGIATAIVLTGFGKKLNGIETVFWNSGMPKDNIALRNMINYYQLAWNCYTPTGEVISDKVQTKGKDYDEEAELSSLLHALAEEGMRCEREGKAFVLSICTLEGKAHSVVVCGATKESGTRYKLKLFDVNSGGDLTGDLGVFEEDDFTTGELTIDLNNNSFSCSAITFDTAITRSNYWYISYIGIDDILGENAIPLLRTKSFSDKAGQDYATLKVSAGKPCTITNAEGETLVLEKGSITGTMAVYDVRVTGEKTLYYKFKVDRSDSFTLSNMQSEVTITADIDHEFYTATADGADTVRLAAGKVEIFGNDYTCEAGLSTGLESADMVICSGNASQDAVLEAKDGSVKFTTEGDNTLLLRLIHEVDQKKVDLTDAHNITVTDTTTSGIVNVDVDGETQAYQVIPNDNESIVSSGSVNKTVFWKINKEGVLSIYGEGPMANYGDPYADGGEYEAPWADYRDDILQIVIEDNIESAGDFAFVDCPNCTSVTISQSVARIGTGAFRGCASLPQIDLPQGIKRIEDWAFNECDSLTSVVIPDGVVYLGSYCFAWCDSLISVTVPDSVTDGGINVFAEDDSLTNVTLGKGLTELPQGMFYSCPALKNIVVPEGVTDLSFCVFEECTALESISLPRSLTYIENEAFKGCNRLSTVRFSGTLAEWKKITIGNNNDYLINRTILCIDGNLAPATDPGTSTDPTPTNDSKPTADSKPTTDSKPITNPEPTVTVKPSTSKKSITKLKVKLSKTSFTYTGKSIRPTVKVMDGTKKLKKGTDYTLKYSNNKKVGKAYVIITGKGAYKGARRKYFKIIPKGTDLTGVSIGSHVVRWKKRKGITGYQIQYGRNSRFKGEKKITLKKSRTTSKAISDFKMGKWYYIRIRTYKTVRGKKYYSTWSDAMKFYWIHRR